MRRDCNGGQSIEILEESCDEDDDLDKILALSTPFRRIDGESDCYVKDRPVCRSEFQSLGFFPESQTDNGHNDSTNMLMCNFTIFFWNFDPFTHAPSLELSPNKNICLLFYRGNV